MEKLTKQVNNNGKNIHYFLLSKIADVKEGLATGDNKFYLYKEETALGSYKIIDKTKVLIQNELDKISNDKKLRDKVIYNGITKDMFDGKTIVPYDKGGASDIEEGRLSNYYYPTRFFIDWSRTNVERLKTYTIADVKKFYDKKVSEDEENNSKIASRFQNMEFSFRKGITFPMTGMYAPTFRLNSNSIFGHGGNCLFIKKEYEDKFRIEFLLGILCSKFTKYCFRNYINNTVNTPPDSYTKILIPVCSSDIIKEIIKTVGIIIKNIMDDLSYSYHEEQKQIDNLVYDSFNLDNLTITEIENWYSRKYPKLK